MLLRPLNGLGRTERERRTGSRAGGFDERERRGVGVAAERTTSLPESVATSTGALTNGVIDGVRDAAPVRPTNAVDARRRYG